MKDFVITCSTPCDMSQYYLRKHKIYYIGFYYYLDDEKFMDDFFTVLTVDEFYNKIKTCNVKTSQPDPEQYVALWSKLIEQGNDILHVELSSGLSGAVNSAMIAKSLTEEKYKDAKIYVVDSKTGSCGIGVLLEKIYDYKKTCDNIEKVYDYAERIKNDVNVIFIVENLDQLIKGGRLSKVAGGIGKLLNIVPILHVDNDGRLENIKKARGLNSAINELVETMSSNYINGEKVLIANSNCFDNAKLLINKINEKFPNIKLNEDCITNIGALIGCHTGEKCLVVSYLGKGRA